MLPAVNPSTLVVFLCSFTASSSLVTWNKNVPEAMFTLAPNVLGVRGRHVHVQVADVWFLRVDLQTLSDPVGLGAPQERIGNKDESWTMSNKKQVFAHKKSLIF